MRLEDIATRTLWSFWAARARPVRRGRVPDDVALRIDAAVRRLHPDLRWEIGPAPQRGWFFALSPNGRPELVAWVEELIATAPRVRGWTFLASKPPREWVRRRLVLRRSDGPVEVDFDTWRFRLEKVLAGIDVSVAPGPDGDGSEDRTIGLTWHLLDAELGEARTLRGDIAVRVLGVRERSRARHRAKDFRRWFADADAVIAPGRRDVETSRR